MQSVFIWRCTSSNNARTIITAFLVSSRSPVLLADDTSGIVRSIPKAVTITAYKADFHAIEHHKYKKLYQNNGLKYSRILCVIVKDCGRNRTAQKSNAATAKRADVPPYIRLHITKIALNSSADYHFTIFTAIYYTASTIK